ncbi:hypothetical protein BC834DRAFT_932181 [Gloeopeniophorella convolvens]|nr:hypothetical protein BC834DRAFT_932181 [Gloeopeniophorella convolvens]
MEKYSAFRDPGTGIQPFLTPVPPSEPSTVAKIALPFAYGLGAIRVAVIAILATIHLVLVSGVCVLLIPIPPLHRFISWVLTALLSRLSLLVLGLWWIPVEQVTRKRGYAAEKWRPGSGDLIVSNWASWIEVLWLAFRFDPIFALPVSASSVQQPEPSSQARSPGRRTGTGSAAISTPGTTSLQPVDIVGFRRASLLRMITFTGRTPFVASAGNFSSLEEIRRSANRPVVVFPECTTSNGRGLLRFAEVFKDRAVPVSGYKVFVMCVRYDPPNALSPTLSHSIPSILNPLPHIMSLVSTITPLNISIRLLPPAESPSSSSFMASEIIPGDVGEDTLSAVCAGLISQLGRMKKTNMGWENKVLFLNLYREKQK